MLFIAQGTANESLEAVFRYPRNRQLVISCVKGKRIKKIDNTERLINGVISVIDSVPENTYEPELIEDLRRLRQYLMAALADPIAPPRLF